MDWLKILEDLVAQRKTLTASVDAVETREALDKLEMDLRKVDIKIKDAQEHVDEEQRNDDGQSQRSREVLDAGAGAGEIGIEKRDKYTPGVGFRKVAGTNFDDKEKRYINVGNEKVEEKELEKRGDVWKGNSVEKRSVVLDETILVPKHQSNEVVALPFNEVSSILDLVKITPFTSGESYEVPFEFETGEADYTGEAKKDGTGGEYNDVETKFDSSKITKSFITAYTEISKQFIKTPSANYAERVQTNIIKSVNKKLAKDIIIGSGTDGAIQGILTQPDTIAIAGGKTKPNRVIDTDISISVLDENTINSVVYKYGGDNDVEEGQVLLMNKMTLLDFAKMRDNNGNKIYDIKTFGGSFEIDGIRGVFTAHIKPFSEASVGDYFMAYGSPKSYEVALFSGLEVAQSKDYKFKQGMTAFSADEFVGGNLTTYKSWIRIKKIAATK